MATTQTELQTSKAIELIDLNINPVLLGRVGNALKVPQRTGWQLAEYSRADVERWPAGNNIGMRCGKMRDGRYLNVPDFDKYAAEIFPAWFHEATGIIPFMVIVKTGSGYHVPLITDGVQEHGIIAGEWVETKQGKRRLDVIIEIRGDGQQVVSPGSVHPSGKEYKIIAGDSLENIPVVTGDQYQQLVNLMRKYDKRPAKKPAFGGGNNFTTNSSGELAGVHTCLDYARAHIAGEIRQERDRQWRVMGNGGLLITEDKASWYCHAEQVGGNVVNMIAWHKDISLVDAAAMVRAQNGDEAQETTETATAAKVITSTADLLDHAFIDRYRDENQRTSGGKLAGELWKEPIMVAPARDHFSGEYPDEPTTSKTCGTYWMADIYKNDNGHQVKAGGVHLSVLHSYITKGGKLIGACPHCLHERTLHLTRLIEKASQQYTHDNLMKITIVSDGEAKRIGERIKKRNQRSDITLSVVKVPQPNGQTLLIHDVDDLEGKALPPERPELYNLVHGLVKNTPKGRRGWRGLVTWGNDKPVQDNRGGGGHQEKDKGDFVARLMGENFGKFATLLRGYLDTDEPITRRKGITFDVDITNFLQFLEDAGLDYAVTEGDLSHLRHKIKGICAKRDTDTLRHGKQPTYRQMIAEIVEYVPGF